MGDNGDKESIVEGIKKLNRCDSSFYPNYIHNVILKYLVFNTYVEYVCPVMDVYLYPMILLDSSQRLAREEEGL